MIDPIALIFVCAGAALVFAVILIFKILKTSEGTEEMIRIANAVKEGASAYLKRQYIGVSLFFSIVFVTFVVKNALLH